MSFHVKIMVIPCLYQAVQTRQALKTIYLLSCLNKKDLKYETVTFSMNQNPAFEWINPGDTRRVSIVCYRHGKNQSDCTNCLKCLRITFKMLLEICSCLRSVTNSFISAEILIIRTFVNVISRHPYSNGHIIYILNTFLMHCHVLNLEQDISVVIN